MGGATVSARGCRDGLAILLAATGLVVIPAHRMATAWQPAAGGEWQSAGSAGPGARYLPPAPPRPNAYTLGVQVRNTPVGVDLLAVQPGSAAALAGLEAGDTIVTVAGQQVGLVGERLHDVGDELARRVAGDGVTLLVRNHRSGGLVNVPVRFSVAARRTVSGQVASRQNLPVSRTAVLLVSVLDVTSPQWRDVAISQDAVPATGRFPVTYRLDVPPLDPRHRYALAARVDDGGRTVLQVPAPVPLAPFEGAVRVDLTLEPVQATGGSTVPPRDQIDRWIRAYLGRPPRPFEVEFWLADLQRGKALVNVQAGILASTELFERQRRDRDLYVAEVHRLLTGRQATAADMAALRSRYDAALGVRLRFVEGLLQQPR
jgi:uncharacterized lipoprotein YbaY